MHLRFVTRDYLIWSLAQVLVDVETVDCMASGVDCFGPKAIRGPVLIKHGSCGFNQGSILPLHNAILLRSVWSAEFMLDSFFIKKFFNICVPKFRAIVTSNMLDLQLLLILGSSYKFLDYPLSFTLILQKENPSEAGKIINNYKTIFVTANAYISDGSKQIHV